MSWADALKLVAMAVLIAVIAVLGRYEISTAPQMQGTAVFVLDRWTGTVRECDGDNSCGVYPTSKAPGIHE